MIANLLNLRETFNKCNYAYFEGKLPVPQFDLLHSFRTCVYFYCDYDQEWLSKKLYNFCISMTDYEMIHYYLAYFGEDTNCTHGKKFKKMAEDLNRKYGLHVTPYLDLSQYKRRPGTPSLSYWFVQKFYM